MKKIILLSAALCLFAGFSASAGQYPQGGDRDRSHHNDQYWQDRMDRDQERAREEARDNGHHYAYGKDPKHHKEGWKRHGKNHPKFHNKNRAKDPNKRADNDRNDNHHTNNR